MSFSSIIVPTFNLQKNVERCINIIIIKQTFTDCEIIVQDNC